jgi:hypothetical protein
MNVFATAKKFIVDHGRLIGLGDDDHPQYLNQTRGDARYYTEIELDAGQLDNRYYTETEIDAFGFLTSETDPIFLASPSASILAGDISNWNEAYGWGDHGEAGYLTDAPSDGETYGRKDGAWEVVTVDPAGSNTQIQFNDNGAFGANANFVWDDSNEAFIVGDTARSGTEKFRVKGGAVLFDGATGSTPVSGAGTRMMWIPAKGAFRVGEVRGTEWDDINIGDKSFAQGFGTKASGDGSVALGKIEDAPGSAEVTASNIGSFVTGAVLRLAPVGDNDGKIISSGGGSFASGLVKGFLGTEQNITASGDGAFAQGFAFGSFGEEVSEIKALGQGSFAQGVASTGAEIEAWGHGGFAQGWCTNGEEIFSQGAGAFAQGCCIPGGSITATGSGSFAHGYAASGSIIASAQNSMAIGDDITASATLAMAFGSGFTNATANSFMVGFTATPTLQVTTNGLGVGQLPTANSPMAISGLPTSSVGLVAGELFTQTATQLGGIGTTKVLCIV